MTTTPLAERIRIVLFGVRNSGKSSLMNNLFGMQVSIVSEVPGTTTDPVTKAMELDRLGPVAVTDVPGFDDEGDLGLLRKDEAEKALTTADIVVFVTRLDRPVTKEESTLFARLSGSKKNIAIALTFADKQDAGGKREVFGDYHAIAIDNMSGNGITLLKEALIAMKDRIDYETTPMEGLVHEGDFVLLVTPIDLAAPKSRLILPQVETIRDILDKDCGCFVVKERELIFFYDTLGIRPVLVITDSQVFGKVAADIPADQPLTSFSILFARKKGDLSYFVEGIAHLKDTPPEAKILVLESCSHHKKGDDIGTVKIPRLFRQLVQPKAVFDFRKELPDEATLAEYYMVINCAGCMVTRKHMMERIRILTSAGVHATNYGLFLAWAGGLLPRALDPFPIERELYITLLKGEAVSR